MRDDLGRPVSAAVVTASSGTGSQTVVSGADGGFTFDALPIGSFVISALKSGYLVGAFGGTHPGKTGTPVVVSNGSRLTGLEITLVRGAVATGHVRMSDGEPASGVAVAAIAATLLEPSSKEPIVPAFVLTDRRGVFRLFGLAPGRYVIAAAMIEAAAADLVELTAQDIDKKFAELRQPGHGTTSLSGFRSSSFSIPTTFFPGAAHEITGSLGLVPGETRDGIDISLARVPTTRISGIVTPPQGEALAPMRATLLSVGPQLGPPFGLKSSTAQLALDGSFRFAGVQPEHYIVFVRSVAPAEPGALGLDAVPVEWWAAERVEVAEQDPPTIRLQLRRGLRFAGRVVEMNGERAVRPAEMFVRLSAAPPNPDVDGLPVALGSHVAQVHPDGTFEVKGLLPGRYAASIEETTGHSCVLLSVAAKGTAASNELVDLSSFSASDIADATLTCSGQAARVSGTAKAEGGLPATGYVIVLFPSDPALWYRDSQRIRTTRPATDGYFDFGNLPPGEYLIGAMTDFDLAAPGALAALPDLAAQSLKFTLDTGEQHIANIRMPR